MTDLIERLRESAKGWEVEAADHIEQLEGTNEVLGQWVEDKDKRIEELEKELAQARAGCYACEPVAAENKRLRAALEMIERSILGTEDQFKAIARDALQETDNED